MEKETSDEKWDSIVKLLSINMDPCETVVGISDSIA